MDTNIVRLRTFKSRVLPASKLNGSNILDGGALWFRITLYSKHGAAKIHETIVDFTVGADYIKLINFNNAEWDGYVWLEQNWKQVENSSDLVIEVAKIWNLYYGDEWPLKVDEAKYKNFDIADLLYSWQVLIKNPQLTLMVNELGWLDKLKDMNAMSAYKDQAKNGGSQAHRWGYRSESRPNIKTEGFENVDATNVVAQMGWTKGQYKIIKELNLDENLAKAFVKFNNDGMEIHWLRDMAAKFGNEFLRWRGDQYGLTEEDKEFDTFSQSKRRRLNRRGRRPRAFHHYGFNYHNAAAEYHSLIEMAKETYGLNAARKKDLITKIIPKRAVTANPQELYEYLHYMKDWIRVNARMENVIVPGDIPRGHEKLSVRKTERVLGLGQNGQGYGYTYRTVEVEELKMKVWHDNSAIDMKVHLSASMSKKFKENVKKAAPKYCMEVGDYVFMLPESPRDLTIEGQRQSHCVGGYSDKVARGDSYIVFMRKKKYPKDPLITIEISGKSILQVRGYSNRIATSEENRIIEQWKNKIKV